MYKSFEFTESLLFQLRGEFYNMSNHQNPQTNIGDNDVSSASFVSASFYRRRQLRLGAKFIFGFWDSIAIE